jgi:3D (Asp-Asp-Asp) domain-containing protein
MKKILLAILIATVIILNLDKITASKTIVIYPEYQEPQKEEKQTGGAEMEAQEENRAEFTAYSAGDGYTPGIIMASTKEVYEGAIACPSKYKFGTKIEVEGKIYTCEDRMAKRFREGEYFDIYMNDINKALQFGRKELAYKIIN